MKPPLRYDPPPLARAISLALTARRMNLRLTQRQLAAMIGTSQSHLSAWETLTMVPSLNSYCRWADALGVEMRVTVTPYAEVQPTE